MEQMIRASKQRSKTSIFYREVLKVVAASVIGGCATYLMLTYGLHLPETAVWFLLLPAITLTIVFMTVRCVWRYRLLCSDGASREQLLQGIKRRNLMQIYLRLAPSLVITIAAQAYAFGYIASRHDLTTGSILAFVGAVSLFAVGRTFYRLAPSMRPVKGWIAEYKDTDEET